MAPGIDPSALPSWPSRQVASHVHPQDSAAPLPFRASLCATIALNRIAKSVLIPTLFPPPSQIPMRTTAPKAQFWNVLNSELVHAFSMLSLSMLSHESLGCSHLHKLGVWQPLYLCSYDFTNCLSGTLNATLRCCCMSP